MKITIAYPDGKTYGTGRDSREATVKSGVQFGNKTLYLNFGFNPAVPGISIWEESPSKAVVSSAVLQLSFKEAQRLATIILWALEQAQDIGEKDGGVCLPDRKL
jgi:hypothetical protein